MLLNKYCALFSEKPPKGFGKFFGERSSKPPKAESEQPSPSPSSESEPSGTPKPQINKPFEFRAKFGKNSGSGGENSGGNNNSEREKWFTFGMIGSAIAIAAISYYGYSYQEISWKDLTK